MTTKERNEIKKEYYRILKDKYKPEALKWIDEVMFQLDMIDRWSEEESERYDILLEIKKEIMEEKYYEKKL